MSRTIIRRDENKLVITRRVVVPSFRGEPEEPPSNTTFPPPLPEPQPLPSNLALSSAPLSLANKSERKKREKRNVSFSSDSACSSRKKTIKEEKKCAPQHCKTTPRAEAKASTPVFRRSLSEEKRKRPEKPKSCGNSSRKASSLSNDSDVLDPYCEQLLAAADEFNKKLLSDLNMQPRSKKYDSSYTDVSCIDTDFFRDSSPEDQDTEGYTDEEPSYIESYQKPTTPKEEHKEQNCPLDHCMASTPYPRKSNKPRDTAGTRELLMQMKKSGKFLPQPACKIKEKSDKSYRKGNTETASNTSPIANSPEHKNSSDGQKERRVSTSSNDSNCSSKPDWTTKEMCDSVGRLTVFEQFLRDPPQQRSNRSKRTYSSGSDAPTQYNMTADENGESEEEERDDE